jgi:hypothetical protein
MLSSKEFVSKIVTENQALFKASQLSDVYDW